MSDQKEQDEVAALHSLIGSLTPFDDEVRFRLLNTVTTFLNIKGLRVASDANLRPEITTTHSHGVVDRGAPSNGRAAGNQFSDHQDMSPKDFLLDKEPHTDVERVVCIAYYLTHYRNTPHFKTLDISSLNTEAAQVKFSNAAYAVDNATRAGFLVPASKGAKQLGALGEQYVRALPDREAASAVRARIRIKRHKRTGKSDKSPAVEMDDLPEEG